MSDPVSTPDSNDPLAADACPVCGAIIDTRATAIAMPMPDGRFLSFKTAACVKLYQSDPARFDNGPAAECPAD